jgi:branched-chain amino acid transport system permease protein
MASVAENPAKPSLFTRLLRSIGRSWGSLLVLALLILFPFLFSWLSGMPVDDGPPKFWQGQLIVVYIMAVFAMSYDLLIGYTGILTFGHAAPFGAGAYATALFLTQVAPRIASRYQFVLPGGAIITQQLLLAVALLLALVVAVFLGLLFSTVSMRVKGHYFAMITLAMAEAIHILSKATDFVRYTGADEGLHGVHVPAWINPTQFRLRFYFIALGFAVLMYLLARRVVNSPTGRVFVAVRENESRARMIGYNPAVYRTVAFVVSGGIAGLAGALYSLWTMSATPSMTSTETTINALLMTILGGIGTLIGPMLGAAVLEISGHFFYQWFGARWPLVFGLIFIGLVMFLPYGIVGTWRLRSAQVRQGWQQWRQRLRGSAT